MEICRRKDEVEISELDPFLAELLRQIPPSANPEGVPAAEQRLILKPVNPITGHDGALVGEPIHEALVGRHPSAPLHDSPPPKQESNSDDLAARAGRVHRDREAQLRAVAGNGNLDAVLVVQAPLKANIRQRQTHGRHPRHHLVRCERLGADE